MERILEINALQEVTLALVEAARETQVKWRKLPPWSNWLDFPKNARNLAPERFQMLRPHLDETDLCGW